jgi:phage-related protein (TIGR01555 family)
MAKTKAAPKGKAAARVALKVPKAPQTAGARDVYTNQASNTGFYTSSQVNAGAYAPYRISLDYLQLLYAYRGSWIVRAIVDTVPEDMLKEWPKIVSERTPEQIAKFESVVAETQTLQKFIENLKWGRLFGGSLAIMIIEGQNDLEKPLRLEDIDLDSYRGLIVVDRWSGCSPSSELNSDIDDPASYGLPVYYQVTTETNQNFKVHHSRVIRATGRDLPLFEKQIQTYWGMSEVEAIWQELQRRDFIESGIADLVPRASLLVMQNDMLAQMLSGVGMTQTQLSDYLMRIKAVSEAISTNGILALGQNEQLFSQSYTFAGLRDIHDASMENISGASGIPMERLGRPIAGLGNNGEMSMQVYTGGIDQKRKHQLRPGMDKLMRVICMSTWGEVPDDFEYRYAPVYVLTAKEQAELAKNRLQPIFDAFDKGLISQRKSLEEMSLQSGELQIFTTITKEDIEAADDEVLSPDLALGVDPETGKALGDGGDDGEGPPKPKGGAKDAAPWLLTFLRRISGTKV